VNLFIEMRLKKMNGIDAIPISSITQLSDGRSVRKSVARTEGRFPW